MAALDDMLDIPGLGDAQRQNLTDVPLPGEMASDTLARRDAQQAVQQQIRAVKGRDLAARGIPTFIDDAGDVQPVRDDAGAALNQMDRKNGIAWSQTDGKPYKLTYGETGAPALSDPYAGVAPEIDPKTGDTYKIAPGLPWQWTGQDPDTVAQVQADQQDKQMSKVATVLSRKQTLDTSALNSDAKDLKVKMKSFEQEYGINPADPKAAHAAIEDFYNQEYASPEANQPTGLFSKDLTPEAIAKRADITQRKSVANSQVDELASAQQDINTRQAGLGAQSKQLNDLQEQLVKADMDKLGLAFDQTPVPLGNEQDATPYLQPDTKAAILSARAGNKPYGVDQSGTPQFEPGKMQDGIQAALQDGLIDPKWAADQKDKFKAVDDQYQALSKSAGGAQVLKALLRGSGKGAVFFAGMQPGAQAGAALGALVPVGGETGITEAIGAALGGLSTGRLAAFAADKILDKLGEFSKTVQSINDAAKLHPQAEGAGELIGGALGAPKALSGLYRASQIAAADGGLSAAAKVVAKQVTGGAIGGAVFEGTARPVFDATRYMLADKLGIPHDQFEAPSVKSLAENAALGVLLAGHSIKFKDYSADDITSLMTRGVVREDAGIAPTADASPDVVTKAFAAKGITDPAKVSSLSQPLSPAEADVYGKLKSAIGQMNTGEKGPAVGAQQAVVGNTPIATAVQHGEAQPAEAPQSSEPIPNLPGPTRQPSDATERMIEYPTRGDVIPMTGTEHRQRREALEAEQADLQQQLAEQPQSATHAALQQGQRQRLAEVENQLQSTPTELPTVDAAAHEAATSPTNDRPEPMEPQKEAGNYKLGKINVGGLPISIEHPEGTRRQPDWQPLTAHYGFLRGSVSGDGEQIDTFVKPGTLEDYKGPVYVINRHKVGDTAKVDHKAVVGASSPEEALAIHNTNYPESLHATPADVATYPDPKSFRNWATGATRRTAPAKGVAVPQEVAKPEPAPEPPKATAPIPGLENHLATTSPAVESPAEAKAPEPAAADEKQPTSAAPAPKESSGTGTVQDTIRAHVADAVKAHAGELQALGHGDILEGPTQGQSGIETDVGTGRITFDSDKLAETTRDLTPPEREAFVKRAVAEEVLHVGFIRYTEESPSNLAKALALLNDPESVAQAREAYGPQFDGLDDYGKAAEITRMLMQGPEKLTEAAYRYLKGFIDWLKAKLTNLTPETREVIAGIEKKLGRSKPRSAQEIAHTEDDTRALLRFPEGTTRVRAIDKQGRVGDALLADVQKGNVLKGAGPYQSIEGMRKTREGKLESTGKPKVIGAANPGDTLGAANPLKAVQDAWSKTVDEMKSQESKHRISSDYDSVQTHANIVANQVKNSIKLDFPKEVDRRAAFSVIESGGSKGRLAEARQKVATSKDSKLAKKYLPIYDHAMANYDDIQSRLQNHIDLMKREHAALKAAGIDVGTAENYVRRILEPPESVKDSLPEPLFAGGGGTGSSRDITKGRVFETTADAIHAGYDPKSTDLADLDANRVEAGRRLIGNRELLESLKTIKSPTDGKPIIGKMETVKTLSGDEARTPRGYTPVNMGGATVPVHDQFAGLFKNLYGESALRNNTVWRGVLRVVAAAKHGTLVADTFHIGRVLYKFATGSLKSPVTFRDGKLAFNIHDGRALLEYADADLDRAVKAGEITQTEADYARKQRPLVDELVKAGMNVGRVADNIFAEGKKLMPFIGGPLEKLNGWIFGKLTRSAMVQTSLVALDRNLKNKAFPTREAAVRQTAKEMNELFGNLQSQGVLKSKTLQDIARIIFLAPQWTESQFRNEGRSYAQLGKAGVNLATGKGLTFGNSAKTMATGFTALFLANQVANYLSRGQSTLQNKEEGHKLDAFIPGGKRGFWLNPFEIAGEYAHAAFKYAAQHENPVDIATHVASNKLSPLGRGIKDLTTGRDSMGRPFLSGADRGRAALTDAIPFPIPLGAGIERDPRQPLGFRINRTPGAAEKQLLQSAGLKVTAAQSPRSQMFELAQPFRADRGRTDSAGEYSQLRSALDNNDTDSAKAEISLLQKNGHTTDQMARALGIKADGTVSPETFAGSRDRDAQMLKTFTPEHREIYNQAQKDNTALAQRFRQLLHGPGVKIDKPVQKVHPALSTMFDGKYN